MDSNDRSVNGLSYRDAGVDIDAGNTLVERIKPLVAATMRPGVISGIGGFGALFGLDTDRYSNPVLVSGTDGVGTKLMLARQLNIHDSIGIDLVAMCVNDILTQGAEPLFFLDYFASGQLELDTAEAVISGIANGCKQASCALIGGETAEMPGMYGNGEYDLAGFSVGIVNHSNIIDGHRITPGHGIVGLASSGPHSNGYSLIRKVLELSGSSLDENCGDSTLGQALLAPTRIYVSSVLKLIKRYAVHGIAHITGGGLTENIVRVVPEGCSVEINVDSWKQPAVFDWIAEHGNVSRREMLRTFNCGIGMVLIIPDGAVEDLLKTADELGETAWEIGRIVKSGTKQTMRYRGF
jgi:phosphoribosylformylglycinamidine cyclo-ligase